jgi:SMODS and SLOG-associating 2TM effector domain family 5
MEGKSYKDYLNKTFLEELNYKIWSTKGSRFNASNRLIKTAQLSNLSISILTVYLIAVGLLSVYNINFNKLDQNLIAYTITCLSILILVFSQIETSKDYKMKAKEFHNCGLELSNLYNDLRIYKTLTEMQTLKDKEKFCKEVSDNYQRILEKHENHSQIDIKMFKTTNAKYHELTKTNVNRIKIEYYIKTDFLFHLLIALPPIVILTLLLYKN